MDRQAPIGVVARSQAHADNLIRELELGNARALSARADSIEGMRLAAVIIDRSALPLPDQYHAVLLGNLLKKPRHGGMYELHPLRRH